LEQHPDLLGQVSKPGLYLDTVPEVRLAVRLHEVGLLPEGHRKQFVQTVGEYAVEGEDTRALNDDEIRGLFSDDEFTQLRERVRSELLPRLHDVRRTLQSGHNSNEPAEEHMQPLLESLDTLKIFFSVDETATKLIERELRASKDWINEHTSEEPTRSPRQLGTVELTQKPASTRSLFDDIDADEEPDVN